MTGGDFNGDGKTDLVYQRASDGLTEIQFLNGLTPVGGGLILNSPFDSSWHIATTVTSTATARAISYGSGPPMGWSRSNF